LVYGNCELQAHLPDSRTVLDLDTVVGEAVSYMKLQSPLLIGNSAANAKMRYKPVQSGGRHSA